MPDQPYTVSREELERLRRQLGDLKQAPGELKHTATLIESMDRLHETLSRLVVIFENANRDMAEEAARGIHDEHAKLDRVLEQNEKIARAIVQLADVVKSHQPPRAQEAPHVMLPPPQAVRPLPPPSQEQPAPIWTMQPPPSAPPIIAPPAPTRLPSLSPMNLPPPLAPPVVAPPMQQPSFSSLPPLAPPSQLSAPLPMPSRMAAFNPPPPNPLPPAPMPHFDMPPPSGLPAFPPLKNTPNPVPSMQPRGMMPVRVAALREQDSFISQPVANVRPPGSPDMPLGPPPPPPPPSSLQKRGLLDRFSFS